MNIRQVLFLCTGNYYRSRLAEELFNHEAPIAGLSWRASSRGLSLKPSPENVGPISVYTRRTLAVRGISPAERLPIVCQIEDLTSSDLVVALKEDEQRALLAKRFPGWEDQAAYWHVHDSDAGEPAEAIAMIDELVRKLVVTLTYRA
jgi:protein-tyrosine phosphatase